MSYPPEKNPKMGSFRMPTNVQCTWVLYLNFNLTKVGPLFTLLHRGSNNSPLLIVFSANYIVQLNRNYTCLKVFQKFWHFDLTTCPRWHENVNFIIFKNTAMHLNHTIWLVKIMTQYPNYKVYTKFTWTQSVMGSYMYKIPYAIA